MKKTILFLVFILSSIAQSFSQDHISIEKPCYAYCLVTENLVLILGQTEDFWLEKEPYLRNKKVKVVRFKSIIDALNYMDLWDGRWLKHTLMVAL